MMHIQDVEQIAILRPSSRSKLCGFGSCNRQVAISCHDLILSNSVFIVGMLEIHAIAITDELCGAMDKLIFLLFTSFVRLIYEFALHAIGVRSSVC
jgi:hypothetical protein